MDKEQHIAPGEVVRPLRRAVDAGVDALRGLSGRGTGAALAATLMVGALLAPEAALAGTGGTEFDDVWDTLVDWTQGTLGRIIAIAIIIVGGCIGVVRQSLMTFAVGLAMGMGLYNAPTIIESIMGSTLEHLPVASGVLPGLGNGLGL